MQWATTNSSTMRPADWSKSVLLSPYFHVLVLINSDRCYPCFALSPVLHDGKQCMFTLCKFCASCVTMAPLGLRRRCFTVFFCGRDGTSFGAPPCHHDCS